MIVVSDTSPILNLARIRRLDLLASLYAQVLIPTAVRAELTTLKDQFSQTVAMALDSWLVTETPTDQALVRELRSRLDAGEAEAIVLALERKATLLLVDEKLGRVAAKTFGLRITGLLGVLVDAKRSRLIEQVKPVLDELISEARFWVSPELYREVLTTVGEIQE